MRPNQPPKSRIVRALRAFAFVVVGAIAAVYIAALLYLRLDQTDLIFPREVAGGELPVPADSLHLPYRTVSFETADSVRLVSWVVPAAHEDSSGMWILLCHGQTGNLATTTRPEYYADLRMIGVNVLAFDWRGFGTSGGTPSEQGLYRDATAAYEYLRTVEHVPADHIIIFGHSLGTAPAIELATRVAAAGLIVEGAPTSVIDRAQEIYPLLPIRWVASVQFNSLGRIAKVTMPKLFLHATADERIPIAHGRRLFAAAQEPKRFVELGGGHPDAFQKDSAHYFTEYARFVSDVRHQQLQQ